LRALAMLPGRVAAPQEVPRWFDSTASATASRGGIFTPASTSARMVKKGERLGTIRDYRGAVVEEVTAPVDGYALYGLAGPPVNAGETVVTIAIPAAGPR
jgi:uncharacterized protein